MQAAVVHAIYIYALYYVATPFDDAPLTPPLANFSHGPILLQRIIYNIIMDTYTCIVQVYTLYLKRRYRTGLNERRTITNEKKAPQKRKDARLESRADVLMIILSDRIYVQMCKSIFYYSLVYSIRTIISSD